jgi:hypothetical protein
MWKKGTTTLGFLQFLVFPFQVIVAVATRSSLYAQESGRMARKTPWFPKVFWFSTPRWNVHHMNVPGPLTNTFTRVDAPTVTTHM